MNQKPVTVRLDPDDHRLLSEEAERLGVRTGTLSRMLIRGALRGAGTLMGATDRQPATSTDTVFDRRDQLLAAAARRGVRNVRVFGSQASGRAAPGSDLDLLVEVEPGRSLLDLVGLTQDLEEMLGLRVDVVTDAGLSPHLRERVLAEAVPL